ncbi:hypothetical protein EYM_05300 [Ignicoccus islandicus DSM 13165]|uniref:Peptidase S8/S53 domain-containing protein n=1 Tax=Ignicoccus islandicus DSM 13165 TaxID=940295 RepID=A0A0U3EB80_9CREN|nr:S8 family serine peptidase [Ignicoccus islandicus]ALU12574.1 hypothetical protein EYM_05300 [Ignicoccus islandicus DSM 13165]
MVNSYKIVYTGGDLANKAIVICNKEMRVVPEAQLDVIAKASESNCVPEVIRVYSLSIVLPEENDIKEALPYVSEGPISDSETPWQLDEDHMNVTSLLEAGPESSREIGVIVIDTGIARNLPEPIRSAIDYENGVALTTFIDHLISNGVCDDSGQVRFSNETYIQTDLGTYYQLPTTVTFKYCLKKFQSSNVTAIYLQAMNVSDQVGHGTFVASQIVGEFEGVYKYLFEGAPYIGQISGTELVSKVFTGIAPPSIGVKVRIIPIKADFLEIWIDGVYSTLDEYLNNASRTEGGKVYLDNSFLHGGAFDDYTLEEASRVAVQLAREGKAKVVNMSLGRWRNSRDDLENSCRSIIDPMVRNGLTVVVAAGNEGRDIKAYNGVHDEYEWPAQCEGVIPVSAFEVTNGLASFSNYDPATFAAPGGLVLGIYTASSYLGGSISGEPVYGYVESENSEKFVLAFSSGTSYAAPEVAGAIAYLYALNFTLDDIKKHARDVGLRGFDKYSGYGYPALGDYIGAANEAQDAAITTETVTVTLTPDASDMEIPAIWLGSPLFVKVVRRLRKGKSSVN